MPFAINIFSRFYFYSCLCNCFSNFFVNLQQYVTITQGSSLEKCTFYAYDIFMSQEGVFEKCFLTYLIISEKNFQTQFFFFHFQLKIARKIKISSEKNSHKNKVFFFHMKLITNSFPNLPLITEGRLLFLKFFIIAVLLIRWSHPSIDAYEMD